MPKILSTTKVDQLKRDAAQSDQLKQHRADLTRTIQELLVVTPHADAQAVIRRLDAAGVYTSEAAAHLLVGPDAIPADGQNTDGIPYPEPPFIPDGDPRALLKTRAAVAFLWRALQTGTVTPAQAVRLLVEIGQVVDDMPKLEADPEFVSAVETSLAVSYGATPPQVDDTEEWEAMHHRAAERLAQTLGMARTAATLV